MFEDSLIELDKKRQRHVPWWIMPAAIAFHVILAGVAVGMQYWNVPPVAEPPINVVFLNAAPPPPPPPPPPPAPKAPTPETPKEVKVVTPTEVIQPVQVPDKIPEPSNEPAVDLGIEGGVEGGVVGGVAGGVVGGVTGGVVGGTPGGVEGGVVDDQPLRVGGNVSRPEKISGNPPIYTEMARRARLQGVVIVEAIINERGEVVNARILKGLPMGLDKAALDAVQRWKFKPATLAGKPVKVFYTLTVNFQVQ